MTHPEDRDKVRRKLKVVAKHLPVFRLVDCLTGKFKKYFGDHHSDDWRECADEMVAEGKLYSDGDDNYSAKPFEGGSK